MANESIILSLDIENLGAEIQNIGKLESALGKLDTELLKIKNQQKDLKKAFKDGEVSQDQFSESTGRSIKQTEELRSRRLQLTQALRNQIKADNSAEQSLNKLRAQYNLLIQQLGQLDRSTKEGSDEFQRQSKIADSLNREIKALEKSYGSTSRNVGNYEEAVDGVNASLSGLRRQQKLLLQQLQKIPLETKKGREEFKKTSKQVTNLNVKIKSLQNSYSSSVRNVGKYQGALGGLSKKFVAITAGIAAFTAAITALVAFGKPAIEAADVQAKAEARLEQALGKTSVALLEQASALQEVSRFGDEAIIQQQAFLASLGFTEEQIQSIIPVALDLAEATGQTLEFAVRNLSKTYSGLTGELGELIPQLKDFTKEELQAGAAVDFAREQFQGQAQAALAGAGAFEQASNTIGDLSETIGRKLIAVLGPAAQGINRFARSIIDFLDPAEKQQDVLRRVQVDLNKELSVLRSSNLTQEQRATVIRGINSEYGQYIPNLISEQSTLEDIEKVQKRVNQLLQEKIILASFEEEITEILNDQLKANKAIVEAETFRSRLNTTDDIVQDNARAAKELNNIADDITIINEQIVEQTPRRIEEVTEKYEKIAQRFGTTLDAIRSKLKAVLGDTEDLIQAQERSLNTLNDEIKKLRDEQNNLDLSNEANVATFLELERQIDSVTQRIQSLRDVAKDVANNPIKLDSVGGLITSTSEDVAIGGVQGVGNNPLDTPTDETAESPFARFLNLSEEEKEQAKQTAISQALDITAAVANAVFQARQQRLEAETDQEIAELQRRRDANLISEEEFERGKLRIEQRAEKQRKQIAKRERGVSLALAIVNVAQGVTRALSSAPPPLNFINAAAVGAAGAVQIGTIAAQKFAKGGQLPFETGGMINGPRHSQGGVKFIANGGIMEAEGGEIILTRGVAKNPRLRAAASSLNVAGGGKRFQSGGLVGDLSPQDSFIGNSVIDAGQISETISSSIGNLKVVNVVTDTEQGINSINTVNSLSEL